MPDKLGGIGGSSESEIPGLIDGIFYGKQGRKPTIPVTGPMFPAQGKTPVYEYDYRFGPVRLSCEIRAKVKDSSDADVAFAYFMKPMVAIWAHDEANEITRRAERKAEFSPKPPKPTPPDYVKKWVKSLSKMGGTIHCNIYDRKWCGLWSEEGIVIRFDDDEIGVSISDTDEDGTMSFHESLKPGADILRVIKRGKREIEKIKRLRSVLRESPVACDNYE